MKKTIALTLALIAGATGVAEAGGHHHHWRGGRGDVIIEDRGISPLLGILGGVAVAGMIGSAMAQRPAVTSSGCYSGPGDDPNLPDCRSVQRQRPLK